jgi:hypothetical protein
MAMQFKESKSKASANVYNLRRFPYRKKISSASYAIWHIAMARYKYSISQLNYFYDHETQTNKQNRRARN